MHTRYLMILSAGFLALLGVSALFLSHEILAYLAAPRTGPLPVLVQLLGAHYLGFALLNWTAKESLIGGIYSRPVALGNFAHFAIGSIVLAKAAASDPLVGSLWIACGGYSVFAGWFGLVLFGSPVKAIPAPRE